MATVAQKKSLMGHTYGDVTEGYTHPTIEELRAALSRLPSVFGGKAEKARKKLASKG